MAADPSRRLRPVAERRPASVADPVSLRSVAGAAGTLEPARLDGLHVVGALWREIRPRQWTKNLMVLAPLVFAHGLDDPLGVLRSLGAFVAFCMVSGAVYLMNDVRDVACDRLHPVKRRRPIAAGLLDPRLGIAAAGVLLVFGLWVAAAIGLALALTVLAYLALQAAYTLSLKHLVILDVMAIATGFVLRVVAGSAAIEVPPSPWLLLCTALLALFLASVKRRQELLDAEIAPGHRPALEAYSPALLDQFIGTLTAATIVGYSVYTFESTWSRHPPELMLTIPFVIYGLFRYLYLVHQRQQGASPDEVLVADLPLAIDLGLWVAVAVAVLYFA